MAQQAKFKVKPASVYKQQIKRLQKKEARRPGTNKNLQHKMAIAKKRVGIRRAKGSLVPVDQDPKVPGTSAAAPPPPSQQQPTEPPNPVTPYTQQQVGEEFSQGAIDPNKVFNFSSYTPSAGQPDPRTPDYWENLNKLLFESQSQYAEGLQEQRYSDIDYGAGLEERGRNRSRQERSLAESMISRGLSYSGSHDVAQAEDATDYVSQMGEFTRSKQREDAARQAAQQAILQGFSQDEAALIAQYVNEQKGAMATEAAKGEPEYSEEAATPGEAAKKKDEKKKGEKGKGKPKRPRTAAERKAKQKRLNIKAKKMGATAKIGPAKPKKKK